MPYPEAPVALTSRSFSLSAVRPKDRFEVLRQSHAGLYDCALPDGAESAGAAIESRAWYFNDMGLGLSRNSPADLQRNSERARRDQIDLYYLIMTVDGSATLVQTGEHRVRLDRPGQWTLVDLAKPLRECTPEGGNFIGVFIRRKALDALLPSSCTVAGGWMPQGPLAALMSSHLLGLAEAAPGTSQAQAGGIARATVALLAASLAAGGYSADAERAGRDCGAGLQRQILRDVECHMLTPGFSVETLCARFCVSRATLYRLLQPHGGLSALVQRLRLQRAHQLLTADGARGRVTRVAEVCGFQAVSHFTRAFQAHFGYGPGDVLFSPGRLSMPPPLGQADRWISWADRLAWGRGDPA